MTDELLRETCADCSGTGAGPDLQRCTTCDGLGEVCDWEPTALYYEGVSLKERIKKLQGRKQ